MGKAKTIKVKWWDILRRYDVGGGDGGWCLRWTWGFKKRGRVSKGCIVVVTHKGKEIPIVNVHWRRGYRFLVIFHNRRKLVLSAYVFA